MTVSKLIPLACAFAALATPTLAQLVEVPRDMYDERLSRRGTTVSFCMHGNALLADFNRDVAEALAGALLVEPNIVPINPLTPPEALDYSIPFTVEELFLMMSNRCDVFMGFTLTTDYPQWLLVTRPYFASRSVLVVGDEDYRQLSDIPVDRPLGTRIFSTEDNQLGALIAGLPAEQQWKRFPYRSYGIALERVMDGTVGASIVWEAAVYNVSDGDPASAGINIRDLPFATTPIEIGIGISSDDRFLEQMLSEAIVALEADGTLHRLAVEHHLAGPR